MIFHHGVRGAVGLFEASEKVDRAFFLLPGYKPLRGLVLDTILGPAEDVEYRSTTAPSSPPPTDS